VLDKLLSEHSMLIMSCYSGVPATSRR